MAASRADHVSSDDKTWTMDQTDIDRVAQVHGRPPRIKRSHVAKRGKAMPHVLLGVVQAGEHLHSGGLERLMRQV